MILVIIAVLMTDTNTLTRTELDITVTMREEYTTLMMEHDSLQEVDSDHMRRNNTILQQSLL